MSYNPLHSHRKNIAESDRPKIDVRIDPRKAVDLRNRLFDKGLSPYAMPSVRRPKLDNISARVKSRPASRSRSGATGPGAQSVNSQRRIAASVEKSNTRIKDISFENRPVTGNPKSKKTSITGFSNAGALRPNTA